MFVRSLPGFVHRLGRRVAAPRHDPLTNLLNCRGFRGRYAEVTAGTPLVLAMLNLNGLKAINDSGKYASGDAHLVRVARALEAALPEGGSAGRWGGDEFALLLPGYDEDGAGNCSAGSRCCCRAP